MSDDHFLSRWSKRKHAVKRADPEPVQPPSPGISSQAPIAATQAPAAPAPLPDVETLTPESDFTPFMSADVDESVRRKALKSLFQDPRFNVMDGLDVYIDDYSKPDPLPEGWLEKMNQVARLGEYREPEPEAPVPVADSSEAAEKALEEVPAESSREPPASDTSMLQDRAPPVPES